MGLNTTDYSFLTTERKYQQGNYRHLTNIPQWDILGEEDTMLIIAKRTLREFWVRLAHRDAEQPLKAWYAEARNATWSTPADIKARYRHASIVGQHRRQ